MKNTKYGIYHNLLSELHYSIPSDLSSLEELEIYKKIAKYSKKKKKPLKEAARHWALNVIAYELNRYDDHSSCSAYWIREDIISIGLGAYSIKYLIQLLEFTTKYKVGKIKTVEFEENSEKKRQQFTEMYLVINQYGDTLDLKTVERLIALNLEIELMQSLDKLKFALIQLPLEFWIDLYELENERKIEEMENIVRSILSI